MKKLRISLLHLAPVTSNIEHNRKLVESAVKVAAREGADWVITPELCIPGYLFMKDIGVDWILPQPDEWMSSFCQLVKALGLSVFLSHPELDTSDGNMYNTVFVIDRDGRIIGKHRKVKALRGAEAWSTGGTEISPIRLSTLGGSVNAGILICADGYKNEVAQALKDSGAEILVSPVSWGPGTCGPDGEWEQRSLDTGLPIVVCNRTGVEPEELDYRRAESVVAQQGKRLLEATSEESVVLSFDWDMDSMMLLSKEFDRAYLPGSG